MTNPDKTHWRPQQPFGTGASVWPLLIALLCGLAMTAGSAYECFYKTGAASSEYALLFLAGTIITLAGAILLVSFVAWLTDKSRRKPD
jgi:hypothetical protein